jgi:hypothetical protein
MKIEDCLGSYLLWIRTDHQKLNVEFEVILSNGSRQQWIAFNQSTKPIDIDFIGVNFKAGLTTTGNVPCLGEIESVVRQDIGFVLEGDFGVVSVVADCVESIETHA